MRRLFAAFVFLLPIFSVALGQAKIIAIKGNKKGQDATHLVNKAIKDCKQQKVRKIILEKGVYEFWPDFASEKYVFTSNNDHGLKKMVFDLSGMQNVEIDGQGSEFIFHGYVCPFLLQNTKNIKISNLSIDYARTFHSEATIIAAYQDSLDLSFSTKYPYKVENSRLIFYDDKNAEYPFGHLLEFDSSKKEIAYMALDYINGVDELTVKKLAEGTIRIYLKGLTGSVGNTLIFNAKDRLVPAFAISNSEQIEINNVIIFHAGGMGVVAQCSKNILLDRLKVIAQKDRMVSLTADATHFVNCQGKITIQNCVLESQMDDACNIHGVYVKIEKIHSPYQVLVKLSHFQQLGLDFLHAGTAVEFVTPAYLATYEENKIKKVERLNKEYLILTFYQSISAKVKLGDIVGSLTDRPEVLIKNCIVQKNRARGVLLGSRGKIVVEDNYFHTWWGAIDFYANGVDWFEQGGVNNVVIRNNTFDNCNFGLNVGLGVITALANIKEHPAHKTYYNKNILIENNKFKVYNPTILSLKSVNGLIFRNNKIEKSNEYQLIPAYAGQQLLSFIITNSVNINIQQ